MRETTSFILTFLISFLSLSYIASAQIKINEKVEIKPLKEISLETNINSKPHSLRFELSWAPANNIEGRITVVNNCGDTLRSGWSGGGSASINISEVRGNLYYFLFEGRGYYADNYEDAAWHYFYSLLSNPSKAIYLDDQLYPLDESQTGGSIGFDYNFGIKLYDNYFCYPSSSGISMPRFTSCNDIALIGSDIVTTGLLQEVITHHFIILTLNSY